MKNINHLINFFGCFPRFAGINPSFKRLLTFNELLHLVLYKGIWMGAYFCAMISVNDVIAMLSPGESYWD